ncbi:MAG: ATP-binding cassette domain-containing protein, partial [candidate division NC10 bacterium]|nr:ATP-binding cassette domain-containing protein [candidate division NC10 bacterium]
MTRLIAFLSKHRRPLFVGILFLILANAFALAIPWVLKEAIDALKGPPPGSLTRYAFFLVVLAALQGLFRFLGRWTLIGAAREIEYELRNQLFRHLLRLPSSFYQKIRTGDLMARATQDVNTIRMLLGAGLMYSANTLLVYGASVTLMLKIDPLLTLVALLSYPLLFLAMKKVRQGIHDRFEEVQEQLARLSDKAQENLSGIRVVKASSLEQDEVKSFARLNDDYVQKNLRLAKVESFSQPLASLAGGLGMAAILWLGGRKVIEGSLTLGGLVAFNTYLGMLLWPTLAMAWIANLYERGRVSMERIEALLKEEPTIGDEEGMVEMEALGGDIEFHSLTFAYQHDGRRPALKEIDLKIPRGTKVALVGPTGSGKSTFLALIPRLLEVPNGHLFIDDLEITRIPLAVLRGSIGYVPQESFLFSDTIRENIAF